MLLSNTWQEIKSNRLKSLRSVSGRWKPGLNLCLSWASAVPLRHLTRSDCETRAELISVASIRPCFCFPSDLLEPKLPITAISANPSDSSLSSANRPRQCGTRTAGKASADLQMRSAHPPGASAKKPPPSPATSPASTYVVLNCRSAHVT